MATIMEKDALLEYVSFGYLVSGMKYTEEMDKDLKAMGRLWREILDTPYEEIDYWAMVERIKKMRSKYERQNIENSAATNDDNRSLVH